MSEIPAEAITATAEFLHDDGCNDGDTATCGRWQCGIDPENRLHSSHARHVEYYRERAAEVLEVASPLITAAERKRIRQLAVEHAAGYFTGNEKDGIEVFPFADLLGGET